jgi:hypothetical protein
VGGGGFTQLIYFSDLKLRTFFYLSNKEKSGIIESLGKFQYREDGNLVFEHKTVQMLDNDLMDRIYYYQK